MPSLGRVSKILQNILEKRGPDSRLDLLLLSIRHSLTEIEENEEKEKLEKRNVVEKRWERIRDLKSLLFFPISFQLRFSFFLTSLNFVKRDAPNRFDFFSEASDIKKYTAKKSFRFFFFLALRLQIVSSKKSKDFLEETIWRRKAKKKKQLNKKKRA